MLWGDRELEYGRDVYGVGAVYGGGGGERVDSYSAEGVGMGSCE